MVFHIVLEKARLSSTFGSDIEYIKFCGQVSTFMKVISNKHGDLLSQFDNSSENNIPFLGRLGDLPPENQK